MTRRLTIQTAPATLSDVIEEGSLGFSKALDQCKMALRSGKLDRIKSELPSGVRPAPQGWDFDDVTLVDETDRGVHVRAIIEEGSLLFAPDLDVYCDYGLLSDVDESRAVIEGMSPRASRSQRAPRPVTPTPMTASPLRRWSSASTGFPTGTAADLPRRYRRSGGPLRDRRQCGDLGRVWGPGHRQPAGRR